MAKRKTLYELAQTVAGHREYLKSLGKGVLLRKLRSQTEAALSRAEGRLFKAVNTQSDLLGYDVYTAAIYVATQDARLAALNEFEKKLRACGGGHIEALEILATMKGEVR